VKANYVSGKFQLPDKQEGERSLLLTYQPTAVVATCNLGVWYDHETAALVMKASQSGYGVTTTAGSEDIAVNMLRTQNVGAGATGYALYELQVRANTNQFTHRWVAIGMLAYQQAEALTIYEVAVQ